MFWSQIILKNYGLKAPNLLHGLKFLMSFACHSHAICISLVCTLLVCHPNVTCMYSYVIRTSLVCTCMSSICHSHVLVYHPYVTRMYSYVIGMSLLCGFTMNFCFYYNISLFVIQNFNRQRFHGFIKYIDIVS